MIELGAGFHPDMSGRENIYINASIFGLKRKEIDERLEDIIKFSELSDFIDNPVRTYSSGMYMRLAFSVAINVNADILLVDEILAVGDSNFQAKCYEKMQELKSEGVTIVLVSHDANKIKSFCDKAIWINGGVISSEGDSSSVVDDYLAYMDQRRLDDINSNVQGGANRSGEHFGNLKAEIISCNILNSKKEIVEALKSDEEFYLEFKYKMNKPLDEIVLGMGIYNLDRLWIFGTNSQMSGYTIKPSEKGGTVLFKCEPLNLMQGRYILQCSIVEANSTPCDFWQEYCRFNVLNPNQEPGIIHYNTSWEVEE